MSRLSESIPRETHPDSEASFASATYSDVEASGPAASPLGFQAPKGEKAYAIVYHGVCTRKRYSSLHLPMHSDILGDNPSAMSR